MCDHGNGMLLIVIRRQPMIFRADERLEECPRLSGKLPKKDGLVSRQPCSRRASGRLIHQAIAGEANQRASMGPATASAAGLESAR